MQFFLWKTATFLLPFTKRNVNKQLGNVKAMLDFRPNLPPVHQAQLRRKRQKTGLLELRIRPRSLLCSTGGGNSDDIYASNSSGSSSGQFNASNTWKFHRPRPKSYRWLLMMTLGRNAVLPFSVPKGEVVFEIQQVFKILNCKLEDFTYI